MKKRSFTLAAILVLGLSTAACANKTEESDKTTFATEQFQPQEQTADEAASAMSENNEAPLQGFLDSSEEGKLTGTVQENKGFMITVISSADSEAYVFSLDDTQSEAYKDIKAGDKITITYTNGLPTPDHLETVVTGIQFPK